MTTMILMMIQKHWKTIFMVTLITTASFGMYLKGRHDANQKTQLKETKEIVRRLQDFEKESLRIEATKEKLQKSRTATPRDDERDSCLMSNDPFSVDCLQSQLHSQDVPTDLSCECRWMRPKCCRSV